MKSLAIITVTAALAFAAPAQAQMFNSGNSGLVGLGNNLFGLQTGHISILNGGVLNGSNVLSGIGLGSSAVAGNSATNTTGSGHAVLPGNGNTYAPGNRGSIVYGSGNTVVPGHGNILVPGNGNVVGAGNMVGNQWGSNVYSNAFNSVRGW